MFALWKTDVPSICYRRLEIFPKNSSEGSECIASLGQANGIWVVPHRGSEVWGLHAILALADRPLAEGGRPWITWVQGAPKIIDGTIGPPSGPGFGVTFDDALIQKPGRSAR